VLGECWVLFGFVVCTGKERALTSALLKFNLVEMLREKKTMTSVYDVASILHVVMLRATDQRRLRAQCAKSYIFPAVMVG